MKDKGSIKKEEVLNNAKRLLIDYDEQTLIRILDDETLLITFNECIEYFDQPSYNDNNQDSIKYNIGIKDGKYSLNTHINASEVLQWLYSLLSAFTSCTNDKNTGLMVLKETMPFIIRKICRLFHEERCVFLIIILLTQNKRKNTTSKREVAEYYCWNTGTNYCPFVSCFKCKHRNSEDENLCGYNENTFPLENILKNLDEKNTIKYNWDNKEITLL